MATGEKVLTFPMAIRQGLESKRADILAALPERLDVDRFIMVALTAVTKNDKLRECSIASIYLAIMESARVGLFPDGKEAALIPYSGHAEFMPMVKGIVNLMLRSPGLLKVEARAVYQGDEFAFVYGLKPDLIHVPKHGSSEITHAYAIAWREATEPTFEVMSQEEIEQARASSRAPDSPAWRQWYGEMARKVVLKRLAKYVDLSPEASRAIEVDHAVTGDPWAGGSMDGPSDEYRNQLIKSQTEASITRLRGRLAGNGDSEQTTDEPNTGLDPMPKPKDGDTPKSWPASHIKELVAQGLAENATNAVMLLNLSPFGAKEPLGKVIQWATIYRARRTEGLEPLLAAETATEEYRDSQ